MAGQDGAKLLDKRLPESVKVYSWCPTMDLVALANVKNAVWIQRLETKQCSWQKLCGIDPLDDADREGKPDKDKDSKEVTAISWRPDGVYLLVLHSWLGKEAY